MGAGDEVRTIQLAAGSACGSSLGWIAGDEGVNVHGGCEEEGVWAPVWKQHSLTLTGSCSFSRLALVSQATARRDPY